MTTDLHPDLVRLGDDLQAAVAADLQVTKPGYIRRRVSRRTAAVLVVGAAVLATMGTAAAAYALLDSGTVARGLSGGSVIFTGTDPTCTTSDHIVFSCTLSHAPTATTISDYRGAKEIFTNQDNDVAGGCIGTDTAGLTWTCYAGEQAVTAHILTPNVLGQHLTGPAVG